MVLRPQNGLSLCAGAGGLDMGLMLAEPEFHTRCFVEWEEYPRSAIIAAQRAGYLAPAPIWDDVTTFDGRPLRGAIDTILAGYPCQPFSAAGKRKGDKDERHLWPEVARIIREVDPEWVFLENVSGHVSLGLETVLRDLWDMGRTPATGIFSAGETGAPHGRQRVFIVAHRNSQQSGSNLGEPHTGSDRRYDIGWCGGNKMAQPDRISRECREGIRSGLCASENGEGSDDHNSRSGVDVENAGCAERRSINAKGHDVDGTQDGRDQGAGRTGEPSEDVADANCRANAGGMERRGPDCTTGGGEGCDFGEGGSHRKRIRAGAGSSGDLLANTGGERPQGQRSNKYNQKRWQEPNGSVGLCYRTGIFPPNPNDAETWAAVLQSDAGAAPALGRGGTVQASKGYISSLVGPDAQGTEQSGAGIMAGRRGFSPLEHEAAKILGAKVVASVRRLTDGLALRPRALRLLGNGVVPLEAAYAWRTLSAAHGLGAVDMDAAGSSTGFHPAGNVTLREATP